MYGTFEFPANNQIWLLSWHFNSQIWLLNSNPIAFSNINPFWRPFRRSTMLASVAFDAYIHAVATHAVLTYYSMESHIMLMLDLVHEPSKKRWARTKIYKKQKNAKISRFFREFQRVARRISMIFVRKSFDRRSKPLNVNLQSAPNSYAYINYRWNPCIIVEYGRF